MLHLLKYDFKIYFRHAQMAFFSIALPIIMASLFSLAITNIDNDDTFARIPVAIVEEDADSVIGGYFMQMMEALSTDEANVLSIVKVTFQEGKDLLEAEEVVGMYIISEDSVRLMVADEGISQSILVLISNRFVQVQNTITNIATQRQDLVMYAMADIMSEIEVNQEVSLGRQAIDAFGYMTITFFAMAILIGMNTGVYSTEAYYPHRSKEYPMFIRTSTSPTKKIKFITSNFIIAVFAQTVYSLIVLAYFIFVLGVDLTRQLPLVILTVVIGCALAISFGTFLGVVVKGSTQKVLAVTTIATMLFYFLGGMMGVNVRIFVRQHALILDRINPVSLISDALYSLIHFDDYQIYITSITTMAAFSIIFCVVSAVVLRRHTYDSV